MSYKLIISDRAAEQIDKVFAYVAINLSNPTAAKNILSDIEIAYGDLESSAESFALCQDTYLRNRGYRKYVLPNYNYVIIYSIKGDTVRISGVFHTKENYIKKL